MARNVTCERCNGKITTPYYIKDVNKEVTILHLRKPSTGKERIPNLCTNCVTSLIDWFYSGKEKKL